MTDGNAHHEGFGGLGGVEYHKETWGKLGMVLRMLFRNCWPMNSQWIHWMAFLGPGADKKLMFRRSWYRCVSLLYPPYKLGTIRPTLWLFNIAIAMEHGP